MTVKQILNVLDPKNHDLPKINLEVSPKKYEVLYIPVFEEDVKKLSKEFSILKKLKVKGEKEEVFDVIEKGQMIKVRGMGKKEKLTNKKIRQMFGSIYLAAIKAKPKSIGIYCELDWVQRGAHGIHLAAINPAIFKPKKKDSKKEVIPEVGFVNKIFKTKTAQAKRALEAGMNNAEGKNLMRVLGAFPPNILSTEVYAEVIKSLAKKWKVNCRHVAKKDLVKYELLNAVSEGSGHDSQLLFFTIHPKSGKTKNSTVVIGKGLCYDSGGVQGKGNYMKSMKEDMAGSASVLGTVLNILKNKSPLKQTTYFIFPLAENMMGQSAMRADDVWHAGDGQTVEIVHTDAEGRLVVAAAMCYAKNNFKNIDKIFTIATLTGSCIVALGELYTGGVCNDEKLGEEVKKAGETSGDLVHMGPWDEDFDDNNSPIADVANLGEKDRDAGWIKAGFFLNRFNFKGKKEAKFCHLDIAGSIDMKASGSPSRRKGFSSGVGVTLLSELLTK